MYRNIYFFFLPFLPLPLKTRPSAPPSDTPSIASTPSSVAPSAPSSEESTCSSLGAASWPSSMSGAPSLAPCRLLRAASIAELIALATGEGDTGRVSSNSRRASNSSVRALSFSTLTCAKSTGSSRPSSGVSCLSCGSTFLSSCTCTSATEGGGVTSDLMFISSSNVLPPVRAPPLPGFGTDRSGAATLVGAAAGWAKPLVSTSVSMFAISGRLHRSASCCGVRPAMFVKARSARCLSSSTTTCMCPSRTALCMGVSESASERTLALAPYSSTTFAHSTWPPAAAYMSAVLPLAVVQSTSAPCSSSATTTSRWPSFCTAAWRAVMPVWSLSLASACRVKLPQYEHSYWLSLRLPAACVRPHREHCTTVPLSVAGTAWLGSAP
mmetsp:Transcript_12168/g.19254  ORF Transcript_12168/g.19254 Transcript_12168/m.19254 type:complete len:382 (-) Transcript_12168:431-1576(-)